MADFRKWFLVLAVVALAGFTANAQTALTCTSNAGVPPIVRAEGMAELVGDVVLNCTGGDSAQTFNVNWQVFLNTNITSRLVSTTLATTTSSAAGTQTEALLLVQDPATLTTSGSGQNVFRGIRAADNSIVWLNVPFTPAIVGSTRIIRFTNVRANANQLGVSSTLIPTQIVMFISASGSQSVPINNPQQTVAFIQPGVDFAVRNCRDTGGRTETFAQCASQASSLYGDSSTTSYSSATHGLRYIERFATAFKTKTRPQLDWPADTVQQNPSVPGAVYNSESGFVNTTALGAETGVATQGTRLIARFTNVPAGVKIFVATVPSTDSGTPATTANLAARLVSTTDPTGAGGDASSPVAAAYSRAVCGSNSSVSVAEVPLSSGSGTATWEITRTDPFAVEQVTFGVVVSYRADTANNLPGLGTASVNGGFAPVPNPAVATMSFTAPVPRFAEPNQNRTMFAISSCATNLLFPYVTNAAGFDTGLAIANTSQDPFGTALQAGACKINFYGSTTGGGAAPAAQTSVTIPGGGMLAWSLSSGNSTQGITATPGFTGYIIAQCAFQFAHGFAFISDLGVQRYAHGYLALVMDGTTGAVPRSGVNSEPLNN